jgi:hypothetical protein
MHIDSAIHLAPAMGLMIRLKQKENLHDGALCSMPLHIRSMEQYMHGVALWSFQ